MGEEQRLLEATQSKPVPAEAELLPRTEVCNITPFGQAVPGVTHPLSKKGFSCVRMKFPVF